MQHFAQYFLPSKKHSERLYNKDDAWRFSENQERDLFEMAELILGSILSDARTLPRLLNLFTNPMAFYSMEHRHIFNAILDLKNNSVGIDIITVTHKLRETNKLFDCGGAVYVASLTNRVASTANFEFHCAIFYQYFIKRVCMTELGYIFSFLKTDEAESFDVLNHIHKLNEKLQRELSRLKNEVRRTGVVLDDAVRLLDSITPDKPFNTPTGVVPFDSFHGGLRRGGLYVLAAQAKQGKTSLAMQIACNVAKSKPVLYLTMEMTDVDLMLRIIAKESRIDLIDLEKGLTDPYRAKAVNTAANVIEEMKFIFQSGAAQTLTDLKATVERLIKEGLGLIVIDYLQLMSEEHGGRKNRTQAEVIAEIVQGIKDIANAIQTPVLLLSGTNRAIDTRADKEPIMSDLHGSSAIEKFADAVFFIYKNEGVPTLFLKLDRHYGMGDHKVPMRYDTTGYSFYEYASSAQDAAPKLQPNTKYDQYDDAPF